MEALQTATVRVVAVIAEGVPEKDTKRLIAYARANNKIIIGPATVGGVQVHCRAYLSKPLLGCQTDLLYGPSVRVQQHQTTTCSPADSSPAGLVIVSWGAGETSIAACNGHRRSGSTMKH